MEIICLANSRKHNEGCFSLSEKNEYPCCISALN